jgi:hypothetical protein
MMGTVRHLIRTYLYLRYFFHKTLRSSAFGPGAVQYVPLTCPQQANPQKKALFRHHVKQFHSAACSAATLACMVNALAEVSGSAGNSMVTQQELLEKVRVGHWKERLSPTGYKGQRGLPLDLLGQVVSACLTTYAINHTCLEIVQAPWNNRRARSVQKILRTRLEQFETLGNGLVIAHFDQGSLVPDLNIPHISLAGGFDPTGDQVLVLDVDPGQPRPYKVSLDRFYRSLSTAYHHIFHAAGYGRGGYIFIRLF